MKGWRSMLEVRKLPEEQRKAAHMLFEHVDRHTFINEAIFYAGVPSSGCSTALRSRRTICIAKTSAATQTAAITA